MRSLRKEREKEKEKKKGVEREDNDYVKEKEMRIKHRAPFTTSRMSAGQSDR